MSLQRGSRGNDVRRLQEALKAAGFNPGPIDGIFGPLTETALKDYQRANQLDASGLLDVPTMNALDFSPSAMDGFGEGTDYTTDKDTRFNGLPGKPEIWYDSDRNRWYAVYDVPGIEPPVPLLFEIPSRADLESFFGNKTPVADRTLTSAQILSVGGVKWGTTNNIPEKDGDVWAGFVDRMDRAMEVQPWLKDPEVYAIYAAAWIEGRPVEEWELQTTDYWQGLNQAERNWITLNAGDPMQAEQVMADNRLAVYRQFESLGIDPSEDLVNFVADKWTTGAWSEPYLQQQMYVLTSPGNLKGADQELRRFVRQEGIELQAGTVMETQVRDLFNQWLGPAFPPNEREVARWAADLRRNPEAAREELMTKLQGSRMRLFPEYTDPNATYDEIAQPWRNFVSRIWGETPDETDPTFLKVVRMNDADEAGQLLRNIGFREGRDTVVNDALSGLMAVTGGNVVRPE